RTKLLEKSYLSLIAPSCFNFYDNDRAIVFRLRLLSKGAHFFVDSPNQIFCRQITVLLRGRCQSFNTKLFFLSCCLCDAVRIENYHVAGLSMVGELRILPIWK